MSKLRHVLVAAAAAALAFAGCKSEEKPESTQAEQPLSVSESAQVTVTAKVKAVDAATRLITLEDAKGHSTTFIASDAIKRLNEVSVGDLVKAQYSIAFTAERRQPTADEVEHPIAAVAIAGRASSDSAPAGGAGVATRVVTTVEAIDIPNMRITLEGPMGDSTTFRARSEENIKKLRIGDTIIITYSEAMALSLVKVAGN